MKKLVCLFLCAVSFLAADEYLEKIIVPTKYYATLVKYCRQYDVPIYYAARLISYESGWQESFINKNKDGSKDYSLCQLNSACLSDFRRWHNNGKKFDPMFYDDNLRIGVAHMKFLYERNGHSWWAMVACYNMGEMAFREWCRGKRPLPNGTQKELNFVFQ